MSIISVISVLKLSYLKVRIHCPEPPGLVEEVEVLLLTSGVTLVRLENTLVGVVGFITGSGAELNIEALICGLVKVCDHKSSVRSRRKGMERWWMGRKKTRLTV